MNAEPEHVHVFLYTPINDITGTHWTLDQLNRWIDGERASEFRWPTDRVEITSLGPRRWMRDAA